MNSGSIPRPKWYSPKSVIHTKDSKQKWAGSDGLGFSVFLWTSPPLLINFVPTALGIGSDPGLPIVGPAGTGQPKAIYRKERKGFAREAGKMQGSQLAHFALDHLPQGAQRFRMGRKEKNEPLLASVAVKTTRSGCGLLVFCRVCRRVKRRRLRTRHPYSPGRRWFGTGRESGCR